MRRPAALLSGVLACRCGTPLVPRRTRYRARRSATRPHISVEAAAVVGLILGAVIDRVLGGLACLREAVLARLQVLACQADDAVRQRVDGHLTDLGGTLERARTEIPSEYERVRLALLDLVPRVTVEEGGALVVGVKAHPGLAGAVLGHRPQPTAEKPVLATPPRLGGMDLIEDARVRALGELIARVLLRARAAGVLPDSCRVIPRDLPLDRLEGHGRDSA